MFGGWNINVNTAGMPQKVATAMSSLAETHLGAEYDFVAYLGSQEVNGINHAVLAQQVVICGRDVNNAVVIIFNEKGNDVSLISIERVVESGGVFGGTDVNIVKEISDDFMKVWNSAFDGFVGSEVTPFAQIGSQVAHGTNYYFAAELTPMTQNPTKQAVLVVINDLEKTVSFVDLLGNKQDKALGYTFSW